MKILEYILLGFFFLLPFHAFGVTFTNHIFFDSSAFPPLLLSGWKELALILFFLFFGIWGIKNWKSIKDNIGPPDVLILLLSATAALLILWKGENIKQIILGIKYDLFFLWIFLIFRHFPFSKEFFKNICITVFSAGVFVVIFGFLQYFSGPDFLIQFGYFDAPSVDTVEKPASFCQLLEGTTSCRLTSTFAGPIRFGAFLVVLTGILFFFFQSYDKKGQSFSLFHKILILLGGSVICFLLFHTASRGAWIAEIILLVSAVAMALRVKLFSWKTFFAGGISFMIIIMALFLSGKADSFLIREGSTGEHWQGVVQSIEVIQQFPAGMGIGTAGAASTHFIEFLNENWYLQIFTELGIVGGIIFLLLVLVINITLYKRGSFFFPLFFALSIMALFTHLWEESALAYIVWAMAGLQLSTRQEKNNKI